MTDKQKQITVIVPVDHNDPIPDLAERLTRTAGLVICVDDYAPRRQVELIRKNVERAHEFPQHRYTIVTASDYVLSELSRMVFVGEFDRRRKPLRCAAELGYAPPHTLTADDLDLFTVDSGGVLTPVDVGPRGFAVNHVDDFIGKTVRSAMLLLECADEVDATEAAWP